MCTASVAGEAPQEHRRQAALLEFDYGTETQVCCDVDGIGVAVVVEWLSCSQRTAHLLTCTRTGTLGLALPNGCTAFRDGHIYTTPLKKGEGRRGDGGGGSGVVYIFRSQACMWYEQSDGQLCIVL